MHASSRRWPVPLCIAAGWSQRPDVDRNVSVAVPHDRKDLLLRQVLQPQDLAQRRASVQVGQELLLHASVLIDQCHTQTQTDTA